MSNMNYNDRYSPNRDFGRNHGGDYGGRERYNRDYDDSRNRGGDYSQNYGRDRRNYNRDYDGFNEYRGGFDSDNYDDWGFGQVFRKMRDLERNFFRGFGGFGGGNTGFPALTFDGNQGGDSNLIPYSGGFNRGLMPFGGAGAGGEGFGELASMLTRNAAVPSVVNVDGKQQLQWQFNVAGFNPDEVTVTTNNNMVEVHARHEDRGRHHAQVREFTRAVQLPEGTNVQAVKSRLQNNGLLTINAPYEGKAIGYNNNEGRELPITHIGSGSNQKHQGGRHGTNTTGGNSSSESTTTPRVTTTH